MFRINTPLRCVDDVNRLVSAGADAFYCGLNDQPGTFGGGGLNQRQSDRSSFASVEELARRLRWCMAAGTKFFLPPTPGFWRNPTLIVSCVSC
ncbi:MAG TPA: hypothetical protein PKG98_01035 [Myxococcota bacterium]|nr:hypothetical protein [Myxococcota bacterium]